MAHCRHWQQLVHAPPPPFAEPFPGGRGMRGGVVDGVGMAVGIDAPIGGMEGGPPGGIENDCAADVMFEIRCITTCPGSGYGLDIGTSW